MQDDEGLPKDVERRVASAHKLVEWLRTLDIPPENVIIRLTVFRYTFIAATPTTLLSAYTRKGLLLGIHKITSIN